jgi:hypothetical protein
MFEGVFSQILSHPSCTQNLLQDSPKAYLKGMFNHFFELLG